MKSRYALLMLTLAMVASSACAIASEETIEGDRYAKLVLSKDEASVMLIKYAESEPGAGYDILFTDTSMTGSLDDAEEHKAEVRSFDYEEQTHVYCMFDELELSVRIAEAVKPSDTTLGFMFQRHRQEETFAMMLVTEIDHESSVWKYMIFSELETSKNAEDAPLNHLFGNPKLVITAEPDVKFERRTAIALHIQLDGSIAVIASESDEKTARVTVRDDTGRIRRNKEGSLMDFAAG